MPTGALTARSELKVRQQTYYLSEYGVVDDGLETSPTDNLPMVQKCLNDIYAAYGEDPAVVTGVYQGAKIVWPGPKRIATPGHFGVYHMSGPVLVKRQIIMEGVAGSEGFSTYIRFHNHTDGFVFDRIDNSDPGTVTGVGATYPFTPTGSNDTIQLSVKDRAVTKTVTVTLAHISLTAAAVAAAIAGATFNEGGLVSTLLTCDTSGGQLRLTTIELGAVAILTVVGGNGLASVGLSAAAHPGVNHFGLEQCAGSVLRNLCIVGNSSHPGAGAVYRPNVHQYGTLIGKGTGHYPLPGSGIIIRCPDVAIENCQIFGFDYDGVSVETADSYTNANGVRLRGVRIATCGRHGVYASGENSNICDFQDVNVSGCGGWGFYERGFLGNTYIGCQVAECGYRVHDVVGLDAVYNFNALDIAGNNNPVKLIAGFADGGVHRSFDGGTIWFHLDTGLDVNGFAPIPTCVFLWGSRTQDGNAPTNMSVWLGTAANGIWVYDESQSPPSWVNVGSVAAGVTDQNIKAICTKTGHIFAATAAGIFHSTDSGVTWALLSTSPATTNCTALIVDASGNLLGGFPTGVMKSTDNGANWTSLVTTAQPVICLAARGTGILAGTSGDGLWLSTDSGGTWSQPATMTGATIRAVAIAIDNTTFFAGRSSGLQKSIDSGANWTLVTNGMSQTTDVRAIAVGTKFASNVWLGFHNTANSQFTQKGGVMRSADTGATFFGQTTGGVLDASETIVGGSYKSLLSTNISAFLGCYNEADNVPELHSGASVIGGILAFETVPPKSNAQVIDPKLNGGNARLTGVLGHNTQFVVRDTSATSSSFLSFTPDSSNYSAYGIDATNGDIQILLNEPNSSVFKNGQVFYFFRTDGVTAEGNNIINIKLSSGSALLSGATTISLTGPNARCAIMADHKNNRFVIVYASPDCTIFTGTNIGTVRQQGAKGATVNSTANLKLGQDGNVFTIHVVAGTINLLDKFNWGSGSEVALIFDGICTVKHNFAASGNNKPIFMKAGVDLVTAAGTVLKVIYDDVNATWYQSN